MATDAMCGLGIAAHVSHLLRFVVFNNLLMEVTMRIKFDGVWELVAQRVLRKVSEHAQAIRGQALSKALPSVATRGVQIPPPAPFIS